MKTRILSIMDTKRKKAGAAILALTLIGIMAVGAAFASAVTATDGGVQGAGAVLSGVTSPNQTGLLRLLSTDGGKTWISEKEYAKTHHGDPFENVEYVEYYSYDAFKAFVDEQKQSLPKYIGATGGYYDEAGVLHEEVWTRKTVDEAIARYERMLEDIKAGVKLSKPIVYDDGTMIGFSINKSDVSVSSTSTESFVDITRNMDAYAGILGGSRLKIENDAVRYYCDGRWVRSVYDENNPDALKIDKDAESIIYFNAVEDKDVSGKGAPVYLKTVRNKATGEIEDLVEMSEAAAWEILNGDDASVVQMARSSGAL